MTRQFLLQGHRGARGLFPENTLEGFRAAHAIGVNSFELDVGLSADNVVVVTHDLALNPALTRDGSGAWLARPGPLVHALTWRELGQYDVGRLRRGTPYAIAFRHQRPIDGARIPRLQDVLEALPNASFNIELKTDPRHPDRTCAPETLADAVLAVLDAAGAGARATIESFDWRGPRHVRRVRPEIATAWLTRRDSAADAALWWGGPTLADFGGSTPRAVAAEGGEIWAPEHRSLTKAEVGEAQSAGLAVLPWTVNDPAIMRRLIDWRVDGFITDRPDLGIEVVAQHPAFSVQP